MQTFLRCCFHSDSYAIQHYFRLCIGGSRIARWFPPKIVFFVYFWILDGWNEFPSADGEVALRGLVAVICVLNSGVFQAIQYYGGGVLGGK